MLVLGREGSGNGKHLWKGEELATTPGENSLPCVPVREGGEGGRGGREVRVARGAIPPSCLLGVERWKCEEFDSSSVSFVAL